MNALSEQSDSLAPFPGFSLCSLACLSLKQLFYSFVGNANNSHVTGNRKQVLSAPSRALLPEIALSPHTH